MKTPFALSSPTRRSLLAGIAAGPALTAFFGSAAASKSRSGRVRPGDPRWPTAIEWSALKTAVGGRLEPVVLPTLDPAEAKINFANQFWLRDQPGYTQMSGWIGAWRSAPSAYVVKAETAADVSAAVRFARAKRLRLVVRGGGHSYLGGSSAPDSLLIWLRPMDQITLHDAFVPAGANTAPAPAVSLGGGCIWLHAYQAVTGGAGRYVQGGGCTTVGVGGLIQGGGFGSHSKQYGTGAASLIEAEVVTADGAVRIVNAAQEPDLFWALKGGGGGTFGVVTRFTLLTHELPATFGAAQWKVQANSDEAYRRLIAAFLDTYATNLFNEHWGEKARVRPDNRLEVDMVFQGLDGATARAAWKPLETFVRDRPQDYTSRTSVTIMPLPARMFWSSDFLGRFAPSAISKDARQGAKPTDFAWAGDTKQGAACWIGYASTWLPASLLERTEVGRLRDALFKASRHHGVELQFNKGLAGGTLAAVEASRATAMNPQVLEAFALATTAALGSSDFAPFPGPDPIQAQATTQALQRADAALREVAPNAGSYLSECDYFMPDWQSRAWGDHYDRLRGIKRRYDPEGLFVVYHGVGSESWSDDGFTHV